MLQKLSEGSTKTPTSDRYEIVDLTLKALGKVTVDYFITNAFNCSKDFLVSDRIFRLVGEDLIKFRKKLLSKPPPKSLKGVAKNLIPPKGMAGSVEGSKLLVYMTDASEIENVVAGDIDSTYASQRPFDSVCTLSRT